MADSAGTPSVFSDPKAALDALFGSMNVPSLEPVLAKQQALEARNERDVAEGDKLFTQQREKLAKFQEENPYPKTELKPFEEKRPEADPIRAFGSNASLLGIALSALTRAPLASALNASAEAISAARAGDLAKYEDARKNWEKNTEIALKNADIEQKAYQNALDLMDKDASLGFAQWKAHAASTNNQAALLMAEAGNIGQMQNYVLSVARARQDMVASMPELQAKADEQQAIMTYASDKAQEWKQANPGQEPTPQQMAQWRVEGRTDLLAKQSQARYYGVGADGQAGGGTINDDTATMIAEQVLAGDRTALTNWGRGAQGSRNLAKIREAVTRLAAARGMSGADIAAATANFEGEKAGQRTAHTQQARINISATEAYKAADLAQQASHRVPRTGFMPANQAVIAFQTQTGDPNVVQFGAAINALVNTYARAINPSGVSTVRDKEHAMELLSMAHTPEQFDAIVQQIQRELKIALEAPEDVIAGKKPEASTDAATEPGAPKAGSVVNGYYFNGGDWRDQANWKYVRDGYYFNGGDWNDPGNWTKVPQ